MRTSIFIAKRLARSAISSSTSLSGLSYESSENLDWAQQPPPPPIQQEETAAFRDVSRREKMRCAQVFTRVFGGVGIGTWSTSVWVRSARARAANQRERRLPSPLPNPILYYGIPCAVVNLMS